MGRRHVVHLLILYLIKWQRRRAWKVRLASFSRQASTRTAFQAICRLLFILLSLRSTARRHPASGRSVLVPVRPALSDFYRHRAMDDASGFA